MLLNDICDKPNNEEIKRFVKGSVQDFFFFFSQWILMFVVQGRCHMVLSDVIISVIPKTKNYLNIVYRAPFFLRKVSFRPHESSRNF